MSDVIDLQEVRRRLASEAPPHPVQEALDALALALSEHDHTWTDRERQLFDSATAYLSGHCKGSD